MVSFLTTMLLFALIISVIVVVHELGHYIAARITGMEVEEFALGMGPVVWQRKHSKSRHVSKVLDFIVWRIFKRKRSDVKSRGTGSGSTDEDSGHIDTVYMLKLFPIGGYVKILGEEEESEQEGSFSQKSVRARVLVACAGVFMNILLGAFFFYIVLAAKGFTYDGIPYYDDFHVVFGEQTVGYAYPVTVIGTVEGSPAEEAGFSSGWEILKVGDTSVKNVEELKKVVSSNAGDIVDITIREEDRGERIIEIAVSEKGTIGVELAQDFKVIVVEYNGIEKVFSGFLHEVNMLKANAFILGKLVVQSIKERDVTPVAQSVAGPVGLVAVIDIVKKYGGVIGILDLIGMFNVALVMMNMLPFPALDGGHVAFLTLEAIRGRPVNQKLQQGLVTVGMLMLFGFMILVSAKDIFQFGVWDWVKGLFGK